MSDIHNNLILTILNSPWTKPEADVTSPVLLPHTNFSYPFHESVDNNFIYLKGEMIYSANTSGNVITLYKVNDNNIEINLSPIVNDINDSIKSNSSDISNLSDLFNSYTSTTESELSDINNTFNAYTSTTETELNEINKAIESIDDVYVNQGNVDVSKQKLIFTNTNGETFEVTNAYALFTDNDIHVVSGVYEPSTGIVTYTTNVGTAFGVSGFTTGMTDSYTTAANLNGETIEFDNNIKGGNLYNVDLSSMLQPLKERLEKLENAEDADTFTESSKLTNTNLNFTRNDGVIYGVDLSPLLKGLTDRVNDLENAEDANTYTTSANLEGTNLIFTRNDSQTYNVNLSSLKSPDNDWAVSNNNMYSLPSGNVGIGTDAPGSKLQINGSDFNDSAIRFLNTASSNSDYWMIGSRSFSSGIDGFEIGRNFGSATGGDSTGGKLYITNTGNVSIGNGYQPTQKLEVAGNILADGGLLKVENNSRTFSVGPENTSWTHFRTNSTNGFYFYRPISIKEDINGEVFKSENNFITVKHDRAKLEIQNKYKTNQHPGLLITDINGDETFRVVTEVEEGTGLGVRSKVESRQGDLWLTSDSNTIEMIPNSSDNAWPRRSTFESNGNFTLRGTIKIEGGNPGAGKVLTSDGVGNATWQTPTSDGTASSNQFAGVGTPVGSVIMWSTNSAPTGWLICDGSWLKKDDYLELYNVIGETYSPNGLRVSNGYIEFQLPDLRSRIPVGYNSSDSNFNDIGKKGGASTHTLTENQIPHKKHRHSIGSGQDSNGNPKSDSASEHFHAISWVRDSSGEGDTLTNDQAKSVIDLFNSRKLNANGSEENWAMKLYNDFVGIVNDAGEYVSSQTNVWAVYNPFSEWDPSNANWVYTGIHKYGPTSNTGGVSNLEAIQQGKVIPDGAHGHSSEFMSTGVAESNPGGSAHNNLQPYIVMNYIICANAVEPTGTGPAEPGGEQQTYN